MKHLSIRPFIISILAVAVLCAAGALARTVTDKSRKGDSSIDVADPQARKALIMHDIGNVRMAMSNWGEQGNPDGVVGFKGFEFPINSGNDFLFSAGVWVGAILNEQRLVSTGTDGDNGTNEFYPVHIGTYPNQNSASGFGDWIVSSTSLDFLGQRYYVRGAKEVDDDGDWTTADDKDGDGRPSANYDGGLGAIGRDDDGDGLVDEDSVYFVQGQLPVEIDVDNDGNVSDTGPSGDANHDGNCKYDPEPHIDEDPPGDISADYIDNDFDGLVDAQDPDFDKDANVGSLDDDGDGLMDEDGVARGAQEYFCVYQDDIEATYVGSPDVDGHTPLKIQVSQRTYAYPEEYAADFILLDFRIRNVGQLRLNDVYIAMFSDPDIGARGEGGDAASLDDFNYYDAGRLMMVQYDALDDDDGPGPGIFAIRVVQTPVPLEDLKITFANFERTAGGDPETNLDKYNLISSGDIAPPTEQAGDWRMLLAFGSAGEPFSIAPGEELPITVAFIAGSDTADGGKNADWALALYNNDFQGPAAPNAPVTYVTPFPDSVRISWENNAEASIDPITQEMDFEGYIVERSVNQQDWYAIAYYDLIDTLEGEFEWQNYNLGMPTNIDTAGRYYFDDTGLIPGHTYYYVVRAFDQGVAGAGILTSSRTGNYVQAKTVRTADTNAPTTLDENEIYVYPNPYKGSHPGEAGGWVNPSKGLIEYPRWIYFMGLPANTEPRQCMVDIYSLAGDHLATIDHCNGTEQDSWNLITENKQEIVSGIYYYTVKYKKPGSGSWERYLDKFVVIK
jgi:hypothetical protein